MLCITTDFLNKSQYLWGDWVKGKIFKSSRQNCIKNLCNVLKIKMQTAVELKEKYIANQLDVFNYLAK